MDKTVRGRLVSGNNNYIKTVDKARLADTADRLSAIETAQTNNALNLWAQLGYATEDVAAALGIPVGTKYTATTSSSSSSKGTGEKSVYNGLGFPTKYEDYIEKAIQSNDGSDEGKRAALLYMYNIAAADDTYDLLDNDMLNRMLGMANLTRSEFDAFVTEYEGGNTDAAKGSQDQQGNNWWSRLAAVLGMSK